MFSNEEFRFGSAAWSDVRDLRSAGLLDGTGLQIGYAAGKPICLETDAPIITIAGAGSGKMRDLLALAIARNAGNRNFVLDPRGEIASVTMVNFVMARSYLYCWNPTYEPMKNASATLKPSAWSCVSVSKNAVLRQRPTRILSNTQ